MTSTDVSSAITIVFPALGVTRARNHRVPVARGEAAPLGAGRHRLRPPKSFVLPLPHLLPPDFRPSGDDHLGEHNCLSQYSSIITQAAPLLTRPMLYQMGGGSHRTCPRLAYRVSWSACCPYRRRVRGGQCYP